MPILREIQASQTPRLPSGRLLRATLTVVAFLAMSPGFAAERVFRAGHAIMDITPTEFPAIVNAMFTERSATKAVDPLNVRALALDDGETRVVIAVVDTCMMQRDLIDRAKEAASKETGIPTARMLVSATHTHSAPSAMACLGSRADPKYQKFLEPKIESAIVAAVKNLQPARVGWTSVDDWEHTFCRRWIRRPDKLLDDPFGQKNVRANMHPGHQSPDAIGPSGPVDPGLSVLAFTTLDKRPLALLANYSQHYYGSPLLSSDYYGRFCGHIAALLGATDASFLAMMSQGTSGDQMWMDYGAPRQNIGYDAYAREVAVRAHEAWGRIQFHDWVPLRMAERKLTQNFRQADEARLAWAGKTADSLGGRLPRSKAEIYALEALHLRDQPTAELKLQALRIGDLGIAAMPNEVYAITGLKLKLQSPLATTFSIELANGSSGYIPPPEQHKLGGYTTWNARTAGLEEQAEPRIVETLLEMLEDVAGKPRRAITVAHGPYTKAILDSKPLAYWRLDEIVPPTARDASGNGHDGTYEDGVAFYLAGAGSGTGISPKPRLTPSSFSGPDQINRAVHFAGGRLKVDSLGVGFDYTVELLAWNGLPSDARATTGILFGRAGTKGDTLGITGTDSTSPGRLFFRSCSNAGQPVVGKTVLALKAWHHVALVREGSRFAVYLNGEAAPEISGSVEPPPGLGKSIFFAGNADGDFRFEGKLDEIAVFDRALSTSEVGAHWKAGGLVANVAVEVQTIPASAVVPAKAAPAAGSGRPPTATPALPPGEALKSIHVADGCRVELAAAEPLVIDPVAIDWDVSGRMWVVEMADYPLGMDGKLKPGGRIRVLEDSDGDGRYDKSTLFAEGINFPTGLITWRDGVIVTAAPDILFLQDTDGDGKADVRRVLYSGFPEGNQQLRVNSLRWGLDNWIYCASGAHHGGYGTGTKIKSALTGEAVALGSRDCRIRPDSGLIDPESGPTQFGRNRDDWGRWFGTQNSWPLWHYVLPDHYLRRNPHIAAPAALQQIVTPKNPEVFPASKQEKRYHSFTEAGRFTSGCAGMIYRDDLLFPRGEIHAFTCEPFHNLVQHNVLTDDGVSFAAHRAPGEKIDFFASEDRWCRPVMTRTGPDGALWVVDMYRYMIEHPDWLPAEGKADLLPHYREGDDKGRIYRVLPTGGAPRKPVRLDKLDIGRLVAALDSTNEWQRDKAQQLLLWRADKSAVPHLEKLARGSQNPLARLHALCALDGLDALKPELVQHALADSHSGVRENALRLAETRATPGVVAAAVKLADDPNPKVRLQLAFTLGEFKDPAAGTALGRLAVASQGDKFLSAAVMSSALPHTLALVDATLQTGGEAQSELSGQLLTLALANNERAAIARLLAPTLTPTNGHFTAKQMTAFAQFLDVLAKRKISLASLQQPESEDSLSRQLAGAEALFADAIGLARTEGGGAQAGSDWNARVAAASLVTRDPRHRADAVRMLAGWLTPQMPADVQRTAIHALAASADDSAPAAFANGWPGFGPETRLAVLDEWMSREPWAFDLLQRIERGEIGAQSVDASRRSRLERHISARVKKLAGKVFTTASAPTRAKVIEDFRPALALKGDATRGAAVHAKLCATCHRVGTVGNDIGSDLRSVASHPSEKLLVSIIDPSAIVEPGYAAYSCTLKNGQELYGLLAAETANSLTFKLADSTTKVVLRTDIATLRSSNLSLMPEGLEAAMTKQDLADLIEFLHGLR
jgi:putative membrane-bound dehydrogenase-like protein